jgi:preprotein translocase subunit YajC
MKVARLFAMVAVIGLISYALVAADGDTHQKPKGLYGTITKVADKLITIQTMAKEEADRKTVEVAVDDKTAVTVDKAEAKLADLKAGMRCFITPDTASDKVPATKIAAWKPKEEAAK